MILTSITPEQICKIDCGFGGFTFSKKIVYPTFKCFFPSKFRYSLTIIFPPLRIFIKQFLVSVVQTTWRIREFGRLHVLQPAFIWK